MRVHLILAFCLLSAASHAQSDTSIIRQHLQELTQTSGFRNHKNLAALNKAADYIERTFRLYADSVHVQEYIVNGSVYKNVIAYYGVNNPKTIIIGAHYDVCGNQQGADDNASGTAGLLELARMLKGKQLTKRIELVAYTLEEPPYFRTEFMGSYIHAQSVAANKQNIEGMICLEMIGYFKQEKHTQDYPVGLLKLFYGNKGNYITLVKKFGAGKFVRQFKRRFKQVDLIRTKVFTGPPSLPGIDFSDHLNYWAVGIPALMITDTAFYRNKNYHEVTDTMQTLDINSMALVINSVLASVSSL